MNSPSGETSFLPLHFNDISRIYFSHYIALLILLRAVNRFLVRVWCAVLRYQWLVCTLLPGDPLHLVSRRQELPQGAGPLVLPLSIRSLTEQYTLRGAFITIGGIIMQSAVWSALLISVKRIPQPTRKKSIKMSTLCNSRTHAGKTWQIISCTINYHSCSLFQLYSCAH